LLNRLISLNGGEMYFFESNKKSFNDLTGASFILSLDLLLGLDDIVVSGVCSLKLRSSLLLS
jgi:hypothetical protein